MNKKITTFKFKDSIRLIPLLDVHIGAPTFDRKAFESTIEYIKNQSNNSNQVYWYIDGDCIENIVKDCVASAYDQILTPTEQVEELLEYLKPIKKKGLFAINGNHSRRTLKQAYYDLMVSMCRRLEIPYLGIGGYIKFEVGKQNYILATQHGDSGATNWELEIKRLARNYPDADIYIMGHDHSLHFEIKPHLSISKLDTEEENYKIFARGGNYLGFAEYARNKSYEMKPTGSLNIKLHSDKKLITGFPMIYINGTRITL